MGETPKELTTPKSTMYVLGEHDLHEEASPGVLDEQAEVVPPLLEKDLLPPTNGVDFDLDAAEATALGNIKRSSNVAASGVSSGSNARPSQRRRVHMFEYAVTSPGNKESVSKEPKFKSLDDAVFSVLGDRSLSREELMVSVQTIVEQGDIAQDDGVSPITETAIGVALMNLMNRNLLVSDGKGKLKAHKVAGGSTDGPESAQTKEVSSAKPSIIDKMNRFVDDMTDKALEGTAYGRLVAKLQSLIDSAPDKIKSKLEGLSERIFHGDTVENILNNLATIEGWVPDSEYANLVTIAEQAVEENEQQKPVVSPSAYTPATPMFPPQKPKAIPVPRPIVPAEVFHKVITVEELNRRAEEARNADMEKLASEKTDEEKTRLIGEAQNFDELYEALRSCKAIRGSQGKIYTAEELILKIEEARKAVYALSFNALNNDITRTHELRNKVKKLWTIEHTYKTAKEHSVEPPPVYVPENTSPKSIEVHSGPKELISRTTTIDELCEAVEKIGEMLGEIKDGEKVFTAESIVDTVRAGGQFDALDLPLTYGIRAKYRDLVRIVPEKSTLGDEEEEISPEPPPVNTEDAQTTPDLYDEPIGPVRKEDLSKEESERIEREMRAQLDATRESFATYEAEYKTKVREGKKMFRSIMEKLGAPEKQRPALAREAEHIEAEKAYMEAKWNLKNFISGRNIKEVPFSRADSLLGLDKVENKKIDVGVLEQAEKEYRLLQDHVLEMTPEKEKSTIEKCFQKWNSLPLAQRVVLSSALLTAGGVALGTIGVSGALAALWWRAGRAFVGTNIGLAAGKMYGDVKEKEVKAKRDEYLGEYGSTKTLEKDQFISEEKELEKFFDQEKSEIRKNQIKKGLVTAAVAGVSTVGLGMSGQAVIGESVPSGAKVSGSSDSVPKPKVVDTVLPQSTKLSWFDRLVKGVPDTETSPSYPTVSVSPEKIEFKFNGYEPVGVKLSSDGFIDTVSKLKTSLQGHSMSPAVEKLLAQSPEKIAMDLGLYKPGQVTESAFGFQGEELTMNINGDISLMHNDGSVNILFDASGKAHQFGEYAGNAMFDADHSATSPLPEDAPSVKAPVVVEAEVKSIPPTSEVGISAASPLTSVAADSVVVGSSLAEAPTPKTINFDKIVAPSAEYTGPQDMIVGKLPLKPEYQFDPKFKAERTAYNLRLEKELMNVPQDMFDLRYPIEYNGGRINVFQKRENILILLNGQKIGTGQIIDGQSGLQYEASLGNGMLGVKSDFEQAFEKAREGIEKNKMFFKVKK